MSGFFVAWVISARRRKKYGPVIVAQGLGYPGFMPGEMWRGCFLGDVYDNPSKGVR